MSAPESPDAAQAPDFAGYTYGSAGYRRIRIAMFLAAVATFAQLYGVQPMMPMLGSHFRLDPATAALSMSLPAVALGLTMLAAGPLSEIVGRTRLVHASLWGSALIGVACAASPTWPLLLTLRTLQGVALAGLSAVAMAYLAEEVHPTSLARAAGSYVGGTAMGGMFGRLLVGAVAQGLGWRGALVALSALALGCAVAVWLVLPPSRRFRPAAVTPANLLQAALRLFADPVLRVLFAIGCAAMGTFVGLFNAVVFRLESPPYSLPVALISLIFLVHLVGSASTSFAGHQADRFGFRAVAPVTALVLLTGVLLTLAAPLPLIVLGMAITSGGFFATHGLASPWVAARAGRGGGATAQATAGYLFFFYAGSAIFGGLAPAAWSFGSWPLTVALCGGLALLVLILTVVLRRMPGLPDPHSNRPETAA